MASKPSADVIDAIHAPVTTVSRRIEIYEADGLTPWRSDALGPEALKGGTITVDSTRDERRSIDMSLDNSSGIYSRDPDGGFWYDKILKVFRGVEYTALDRYADMILREGPALYYRVGNPVVDRDLGPWAIPMNRVGTPTTVGPITRAPDANASVRFSGSGGYMSTGVLPTGFPALTWDSLTLEAWIRPIGQGALAGGNIFGRDDLDARIQVAADGTFQAYFKNAIGTVANAQDLTPIIPGRIYHIAATWDGATVRLYRDGKYISQSALAGPLQAGTNGFAIGGDQSTLRSLRGDVADAVYFDRVLSAEEIARHYLAGSSTTRSRLTWEAQIGEFMIDSIKEPRFPRSTLITGRDMTKRCIVAKLPVAMSFDGSTRIEELVRAMAANAGVTKFNLPVSGATIGQSMAFERNTPRWDVMKKVCEASSMELFFSADGYLTMRKRLDPSTSPSSLVLLTGTKGNLVDWQKTSTDAEIINRVICCSTDSTDTLPFYGEASNTDPSSPTSIQRLGERTWEYDSAFFTSNAQCTETARQFLSVKGLETFSVDFQSLVFPWLEAGEIVEFLDPNAPAYDPTRFLLSSFGIPLKLGTMSGSAKRISIVGNLNGTGGSV